MTKSTDATNQPDSLQVLDPFVRVFYWTLAVGFFVAYLTEHAGGRAEHGSADV